MIPAFSAFLLLLLAAGFSLIRRHFMELLILTVPILFSGYFIVSIYLFSFGEDMPFTYYSRDSWDDYGYVIVMFCLHFFVVFLVFLVARIFDRRRYKGIDITSLNKASLGIVGALFCATPVFFILMAVPLNELWYRPRFIFESDSASWMRFADLTLFLSAVLTPFIRSSTFKYGILFIVSAAFLAVGSRSGIVMIILFVAIEVIILHRQNRWLSLAFFLVGLCLLGVILLLRVENEGGLLAVMRAVVSTKPSTLVAMSVYGLNYIFNLSFVLIGELSQGVQAEARWFNYSILPLPSFVFDQTAEYDAQNRFRANVPYPGFGYALAYLGTVRYLVIVFLTSLTFMSFRKYLSTRRDIFEGVLCFAFFIFPFLILLQYNLRTGSRLIYLLAFIFFAVALLRRVKLGRVL